MRRQIKPVTPCSEAGAWSNKETNTLFAILEWDRDHLTDIMERIPVDLENEAEMSDAVGQMAFLLEDDLRADIRYHYIDVSIWAGLVLGVIEKADYRAISRYCLERRMAKNAEEKGKDKDEKK